MSKSDKFVVRKAEGVVPKSIRRTEKQMDIVLKGLSRGYADEVWNDIDELEEFGTHTRLNHKQPLR